MSDLYKTHDLSRVFAIVVDGLTECGKSWRAAHRAPSVYGDLAPDGWFVAPYFDLAQGFNQSIEPQYQPFPNISRTEPGLMFNGVSNRTFSVVIHLMAEDMRYGMTSLREALAWLADLNQPSYSVGGKRYAPPKMQVLVGSVSRMTCVAEQVTIRYVGPWTTSPDGYPYPQAVDVSLSFVSVPEAFQNYGGGVGGTRPHRATEAYRG